MRKAPEPPPTAVRRLVNPPKRGDVGSLTLWCAARASARIATRAACTCSPWPLGFISRVRRAIRAWQCWVSYQATDDRQKAWVSSIEAAQAHGTGQRLWGALVASPVSVLEIGCCFSHSRRRIARSSPASVAESDLGQNGQLGGGGEALPSRELADLRVGHGASMCPGKQELPDADHPDPGQRTAPSAQMLMERGCLTSR